jgi:hypothetical protein
MMLDTPLIGDLRLTIRDEKGNAYVDFPITGAMFSSHTALLPQVPGEGLPGVLCYRLPASVGNEE